MRTLAVYLLALIALGVGAAFAVPHWIEAEDESGGGVGLRPPSASPPVVVSVVRRAPFVDTLEALGTVIANESVELTPKRADQVIALHFDDGDRAEAGQLLVELESTEERAQLTEAAAVRDQQKDNLDRAQELYQSEMLSERELDAARTALAAAEARVARLGAAVEDSEVRAPFTGVLGLRRVSRGAFVQPNTVIATLDDLSVVKLDFTLPETWLSEVRPGMEVTARSDAWPATEFGGRVTQLDTRLDRTSRSLTVRAVLPNPEMRLRPGMLLKVHVQRGEAPVLQIPEEAVIPSGTDEWVFVVDDAGVARRTEIETGRRRPGVIEVTAGLEAGARVVIEGIVRVRPDIAVQVVATREP